ncbi:MAG: hypothetical protein P8L85_00780 [Rubripirellula sp.]|nr:hypothetical protein [Rubripirellula sp.]
MRSIVWTAGVIAVGVVFVLLVPLPFSGRAWAAAGDLVHAPLFGCLSFAAMTALERLRPLRESFAKLTVRGIVVMLVISLIGAMMEILQNYMGRSPSLHDAVSNALGCAAAVLVYIGWRWHRRRPEKKYCSQMLFLASGCLLALSWYAPAMVLRDVLNVKRNFPLLASFETDAEMGRFWFDDSQGVRRPSDATEGLYSLELICEPTSFPRISLIELESDWSQAEAFEIDVRLESPSRGRVTLVIKVVDQVDRDAVNAYQGTWTLEPGSYKRIRIAREALLAGSGERSLDLSRIHYVGIGLVEPEMTTRLRIDRLRIVR